MLQIRRATNDDAELLARLNAPVQQLHHEARPDFYKPPAITPEIIAVFREHLLDEQTYIFIGEVDDQPIGYVMVLVSERQDDPYCYGMKTVIIDQLSVNPEYRSKGYGEALMHHVFDLAKSLGVKMLMLSVWSFNERAIAFYERQGFTSRSLRMETYLE